MLRKTVKPYPEILPVLTSLRFWAAYATWADIDDALGRRSESIRLYRFAIERDGRHGDWHYSLGRLLADAGDEGAARAAFQRAREIGNGVAPVPSTSTVSLA